MGTENNWEKALQDARSLLYLQHRGRAKQHQERVGGERNHTEERKSETVILLNGKEKRTFVGRKKSEEYNVEFRNSVTLRNQKHYEDITKKGGNSIHM